MKEQLLYEVHDPARYLTPDVTADFSRVRSSQTSAPIACEVSNAGGSARPDKLKVTVGFDGGFQGEAGVSYAGPAAQERGRLAAEIVRERLARVHGIKPDLRVDLIGVNSLFATAGVRAADAQDVRLHVTLRSRTRGRRRTDAVGGRIAAVLRPGRRRRLSRRHHAVRDDEIGPDRARARQADLGDFGRMNAPRRNARRIVRDIAHARAGDKGNTSNVNVWAYDPADFELLKRTLTAERIKRAFPA